MKEWYFLMSNYIRVALLGAIGNPNLGDEAVLSANLNYIYSRYGDNCKVYVFTKNSSYTSLYSSLENMQIVSVDFLHQFAVNCNYDINLMMNKSEELLNFDYSDLSNISYAYLHNIFKEIDLLHVIGGGYINSLWPDMLYEVYLATKLALKYEKKYCFTGISSYPLNEEHKLLVEEMFNRASFVDFRDDSYQQFLLSNNEKIEKTTDDAIKLSSIYPCNESYKKYATFTFHNWKNSKSNITYFLQTVIIPFAEACLNNHVVNEFKVLGFSDGDLDIWKNVEIPDSVKRNIEYVSLHITNDIDYAKYLISNARFNIGSRFHQAVFSLSSNVPQLSVSYDEYYANKLNSIHREYNSKYVIGIDEVNENVLNDFIENLDIVCRDISEASDTVDLLYRKKLKKLDSLYGCSWNPALYENTNKIYSPKISVIIPIYNKAAYLRECLDSILCQDLKDIEVLCLNDGSTDGSLSILEEYGCKDERIKVINDSNHGVSYTRNHGIKLAKGQFLFFIDPDDFLPDDGVLQDLYNNAVDNDVLICGGKLIEYTPNGINDNWTGHASKYQFNKNGLVNYKDYQFDYGWVRFLYSRKLIVEKELFFNDLTFFEDPVFFVKAMHEAGSFFALTRPTYTYRTGYKSGELSYSQVLDLIKGMTVNIKFAKQNNYLTLLSLEEFRLINDYSEFIYKYLPLKQSVELTNLIKYLNDILYDGKDAIEYKIFNTIMQRALEKVPNGSNGIKTIHEIYGSTTWKVGNIIMYIPKKLKEWKRKL